MSAEASWYFQHLSKAKQQAYHCIRQGLEAMEPAFAVPRLDSRELSDIFFQVRMDHPELFYAVTFHYRFYSNADHVEFQPEYIFPKGKLQEHR